MIWSSQCSEVDLSWTCGCGTRPLCSHCFLRYHPLIKTCKNRKSTAVWAAISQSYSRHTGLNMKVVLFSCASELSHLCWRLDLVQPSDCVQGAFMAPAWSLDPSHTRLCAHDDLAPSAQGCFCQLRLSKITAISRLARLVERQERVKCQVMISTLITLERLNGGCDVLPLIRGGGTVSLTTRWADGHCCSLIKKVPVSDTVPGWRGGRGI